MLIDGRLVPAGGVLRTDAAIIGAGPAGLTIAKELAATGVGVLLLEAGGRHHTKADDDALTGAGTGQPFPLVRSRRRGFGGTSGHWGPETGLRTRPLDAIDFQARPPRPDDGWPFGLDALAPYYARAHAAIGMADGYEAATWEMDRATPLVADGSLQVAMFRFAPYDAFTRQFDALTSAPYLDVALHSTVRTITTNGDGAVTELDVVCPGGNHFTVEPRVTVLAAGGVDNARILLSSPGPSGRGVGNEHDNVGRYFMDHLSVDSGVIVPASGVDLNVRRFMGHGPQDDRHQPMLWLGADIIEREGLLNAAFWLNEQAPEYLSAGVGAARALRTAWHGTPRQGLGRYAWQTARHAPDLARFAVRRATRRPVTDPVIALRLMTEQVPDRESRITLADSRDALGIPRVSLDWRISQLDLETVRRHQDVLATELEARGLGTVEQRYEPETQRSPVMSNFHHIGATRMHASPRLGVVDADGRVFATPNLFVAGSSVFPAGGYLNPTLTIVALAIRTADTVRRELTDRPAVRSATA